MAIPPNRPRNGSPQPMGEIIRENVLAPYRERILYPAAAVAAIVVLPLAIVHFMEGNRAIASLLVVLVLMLAADVAALARGRRPPVPYAMLLVPALAAISISLVHHGIPAALWVYPVVTFGYFALPRRMANAVGIAMAALGTALLLLYHDPGLALRYCVSLGFVIGTTNVLLEAVEHMHARALEQSVTDAATGTYSRRHLETCIGHLVERRSRTGETATLLWIDFDRFTRVNDRFGVAGGDRVLHRFAGQARARLRPQDILFRAGGEQFAVLLPDTPLAAGAGVAEELRAMVERGDLADGHPVTISVGVSEVRAEDGFEEWTRRASRALRHAKDEGRNRVTSDAALGAA